VSLLCRKAPTFHFKSLSLFSLKFPPFIQLPCCELPLPIHLQSLLGGISSHSREKWNNLCAHISGTINPNFTKFPARITRGRRLDLLWRRCNTLCTSGLVDDVILSRSGHYGAGDACLWRNSGRKPLLCLSLNSALKSSKIKPTVGAISSGRSGTQNLFPNSRRL